MLYYNNYYVVVPSSVPEGRWGGVGGRFSKIYMYDIYLFKLLNAENINFTAITYIILNINFHIFQPHKQL